MAVKRKPKKKAPAAPVEPADPPKTQAQGTVVIDVGDSPDPSLLIEKLDAIRRKEIEREYRRQVAAKEIASYRWAIARDVHRLEDGVSKLNFETHPFQVGIYQDDSLDLVVYGAAQYGKTELLIVDMAASAGYGLKVFVVTSKVDKRNKFVAGRLDPCFRSVDVYRQMLEAAAGRHATADSTQLKHFGNGLINLVAATADRDFTSHAADKVLIDEHQECDRDNIRMVDDRMAGSWFAGMFRVGHPTTAGTEQNQNLDWLYSQSDRRIWKVPCPVCKTHQMLTWWDHVVEEEQGKGGVLTTHVRDKEWRPGNKFDIRPVCQHCNRPMDRLHREGIWEAQSPHVERRHGYKLSNLYNANRRLDFLLEKYRGAKHSAPQMQNFVNKELGEPWDMDGTKITDAILAACASGTGRGVDSYRFIPSSHFNWKKSDAD